MRRLAWSPPAADRDPPPTRSTDHAPGVAARDAAPPVAQTGPAAQPGRPDPPGGAVEEVVLGRILAQRGAGVPTEATITAMVRAVAPLLSDGAVRAAVDRVRASVDGLGPLAPLLADDAVSDVLVNGPGPVWVERAGVIEATDVVVDRPAIDLLIERILAPLGRRVDPASPVVDGRLADGSRVHVVVPPLAVDGPCLTIRRFATRRIDLADVAVPPVAALLRWAVRARANVLVAGGTGSGKTTLLNAMAASIPERERVVTVEDAAELRLPLAHVVRLETRPASVEGTVAVTCRDLVRNALRMRPDRLIVGEVRAGEALDMVQAMNTGHDGSLSTIHANGCDDALRRLETLVLLADVGLPLDAVRDHIAAAVDLVVHIARRPDGGRHVAAVAQVVGPGTPDVRSVGVDGPRATLALSSADEGGRVPGTGRTVPLADADGVRCLPTRGARNPGAGPPERSWVQP